MLLGLHVCIARSQPLILVPLFLNPPAGGTNWREEFNKTALELISLTAAAGCHRSDKVRESASEVAASALLKIERAAIAAATPITYDPKELLLLMFEHLKACGLHGTAAQLAQEAALSRVLPQQGPLPAGSNPVAALGTVAAVAAAALATPHGAPRSAVPDTPQTVQLTSEVAAARVGGASTSGRDHKPPAFGTTPTSTLKRKSLLVSPNLLPLVDSKAAAHVAAPAGNTPGPLGLGSGLEGSHKRSASRHHRLKSCTHAAARPDDVFPVPTAQTPGTAGKSARRHASMPDAQNSKALPPPRTSGKLESRSRQKQPGTLAPETATPTGNFSTPAQINPAHSSAIKAAAADTHSGSVRSKKSRKRSNLGDAKDYNSGKKQRVLPGTGTGVQQQSKQQSSEDMLFRNTSYDDAAAAAAAAFAQGQSSKSGWTPAADAGAADGEHKRKQRHNKAAATPTDHANQAASATPVLAFDSHSSRKQAAAGASTSGKSPKKASRSAATPSSNQHILAALEAYNRGGGDSPAAAPRSRLLDHLPSRRTATLVRRDSSGKATLQISLTVFPFSQGCCYSICLFVFKLLPWLHQ